MYSMLALRTFYGIKFVSNNNIIACKEFVPEILSGLRIRFPEKPYFRFVLTSHPVSVSGSLFSNDEPENDDVCGKL